MDVFEGLISKLEQELGIPPTTLVGQTHAVTDSEYYKARIDAVHFALDNDDGARTRHYDKADIINEIELRAEIEMAKLSRNI